MFAKIDEKTGESITTASPIPLPALNVSGNWNPSQICCMRVFLVLLLLPGLDT